MHSETCLDTCLLIEVLHGLLQEDELNYSHKVGALAVIQHQKTLILSSSLPSSLFLRASLWTVVRLELFCILNLLGHMFADRSFARAAARG